MLHLNKKEGRIREKGSILKQKIVPGKVGVHVYPKGGEHNLEGIIFLSLETTGLGEIDNIIEIGAIKINQGDVASPAFPAISYSPALTTLWRRFENSGVLGVKVKKRDAP